MRRLAQLSAPFGLQAAVAIAVGAFYYMLFEMVFRSYEVVPDWTWLLAFYGSPFVLGIVVGKAWSVLVVPAAALAGFGLWQAMDPVFPPTGIGTRLAGFLLDISIFWAAPIAASAGAGDLTRRALRWVHGKRAILTDAQA